MSYQFADKGASIEIESEAGKKLVMKHTIAEVSVVRDNVIKINTGNPLETVYINYPEVTLPVTPDVLTLRNTINGWITDCLCCDCDEGPLPEE